MGPDILSGITGIDDLRIISLSQPQLHQVRDALGRDRLGVTRGFQPIYRFDERGPQIIGLVYLLDQGSSPRVHNSGRGYGLKTRWCVDIGTRLPGLSLFSKRKVVVDNPVFPDPGI